MAKKVILKDSNNVEILPITRGELVLDSSGKLALHSNEFLATDSLPGLMSKEDKAKLDRLNENGAIIDLVSATTDGLAPKIGTAAASTVTTQADEWVLTSTKGATPTWRKLPTNAFLNYYRPILVNGTSLLGNNNTALNIAAGTNINLTTDAGKVTINNGLTKVSQLINDSGYLTSDSLNNYVTLNTDQEITGTKTFTKQLKFTVAKGTAPFLVTSDTNVTNLNADLLDGLHGSEFCYTISGQINLDCNKPTYGSHAAVYRFSDLPSNAFPAAAYGNMLVVGNGYDTMYQLGASYHNDSLYFRSGIYKGGYTGNYNISNASWKRIAFTDSNITGNAATADKLKTKVKLWGNDFDGSSDVNGDISLGGKKIYWHVDPEHYYIGTSYTISSQSTNLDYEAAAGHRFLSFNKELLRITTSGYVGVGTTDPKSKLDVNGSISNKDIINCYLDGTVNRLTMRVVDNVGMVYAFNESESGYKKLLIGRNDGTTITIAENGNVGIGTYYPLRKLDVNGSLFATKLITSGGTSSLFVKGDGSLDSNTYATTSSLGNYLPLSGGTMTVDALIKWNEGTRYDWSSNPGQGFKILPYNASVFYGCGIHVADSFYRWQLAYNVSKGNFVYRVGDNAIKDFEGNPWRTLVDSNNYSGYLPFLNSGSVHATNSSIIYAPVSAGTANLVLISSGSGAPIWTNLDSISAGSAASATKLQTKRKIWGLDFDGTADVSGSLTGVTSINAVSNLHLEIRTPSGSNKYIYLRYNSSITSSILLTGTYFGPSSDSSGKLSLGTSADKWDHVYAKTFIGNLDGTYVNKLTGYTKATSASDLVTTDTLNTALGKLEYKAGIAYSWYRTITEDDTDEIINKWDEVVDFVNNLEVDLTEEFVTRKTDLTITGIKTFQEHGGSSSTTIKSGSIINKVYTWGGWARAINFSNTDTNATGETTTALASFGVYGGGYGLQHTGSNQINYLYLAHQDLDHGTAVFKVYSNKATISGNEIYHKGNLKNLSDLNDDVVRGKYLRLTGGIIKNGSIDTPLILNTSRTEGDIGMRFSLNDVSKGWIGYNNSYGTYLYTYTGPHRLGIKDNGVAYCDSYTLLHSGNSHIKNGVITINGNTITPLTSHLSLADYVTLNTKLTITGAKSFSTVVNIQGTSNFSEGIRLHHCASLSSLWFGAVNNSGYDPGMWGITVDSNGMRFRGTSSTTGTSASDYINILHGGNVGIGSTSPQWKLDVSGGIGGHSLTLRKDVGSAEASVTDQLHYLQLQVMRKSDTHSIAIGVMPTGSGVIWAKALGIGYNTLYLNPHSNGVAIGCDDLKLPQLNDGYYFHIFGSTLSTSSITATKFIKSGSSDSYVLLGGGGHKAISDFLLKSEIANQELSANLTTITKSLTVTADWMDTGISGTDLTTGTYIVLLSVSANNSTDALYDCFWSGVLTWFSGKNYTTTNDTETDEIILHRSGHAYHNTIYLRTIMTTSTDGRGLKLLIAANKNIGAAYTYTFKFKRII